MTRDFATVRVGDLALQLFDFLVHELDEETRAHAKRMLEKAQAS